MDLFFTQAPWNYYLTTASTWVLSLAENADRVVYVSFLKRILAILLCMTQAVVFFLCPLTLKNIAASSNIVH